MQSGCLVTHSPLTSKVVGLNGKDGICLLIVMVYSGLLTQLVPETVNETANLLFEYFVMVYYEKSNI